jgi:hypothetical protein
MSVYTVHEPPPRRDEVAADPVRFKFVRDGFHFWAFVLGPVWMLFHRLWLVFLLYVLVSAALHAGLWLIGTAGATKFFIGACVSLLIGLEAPTLRRWTLSRNRWVTVGVVSADDAETAERRFFDAWTAQAPRPWPEHLPEPVSPFPARSGQSSAVIGLFPEPGARR